MNLTSTREELESELKRAGAKFKGKSCTCPFHEDKHASAGIYEHDGVWRFKCQVPTCGVHGDLFDVRARLQGRDLKEVIRDEIGIEDEVVKPAKRVFADVESIRRSVSSLGEVQAVYQYANPDTKAVEVVQVRYFDGEKKRFLTHRAVVGGFVLGGVPKPWPIYNRSRVRESQVVVVVEGEKCVHALQSLGIVATTSLSGSDNADKADWSLLAGKKVYIWRDNDGAGQMYQDAVLSMLSALDPAPQVYAVDVTKTGVGEKEDVADLIDRGATSEDIQVILRECSEFAGASNELFERLEAVIDGTYTNLAWPWPKLTMMSKSLLPATTCVVCGDPSAGKSMMIMESLIYWRRNGIKCAARMLEDDRAFHLNRALAIMSGMWEILDDVWGREYPTELLTEYEKHREELDALATCVDATRMAKVHYRDILQWIEMRGASGCKIVVVDPITAVQAGEQRQIQDEDFLRDVQVVIAKYSMRLIMVTHPRTAGKNWKRCTIDDAAGGRAFSRNTQTLLWLNAHHPPEAFAISSACGIEHIDCNRSISIGKGRNGPATGWRIAFNVGSDVKFTEIGVVTKGDA